jgi:phospholipase/carboxylesterase
MSANNSAEPRLVASGDSLAKTGLVHRVLEPAKNGPHPTVIMVHGRSGDEDVMWIFKHTIPENWLLIAPRAPEVDPRGAYSWDVRPEGQWPTYEDLLPGAIALLDFIHALPNEYDVDWNNLYLMGFSQGAAISLVAAMQDDVPLLGVAALVGFLPNIDIAVAVALRDMPIHMAVGREDESIPLKLSERSAKTLVEIGARLDYRAYDIGHKLNAQGMRDLKTWWARRAAINK